jgi:hypothetical protein
MGLKEELQREVRNVFATTFSERTGHVVPDTDDIQLGNDAVTLHEAAVLYADLADSTKLVDGYRDWFAADVYKSASSARQGSFEHTKEPLLPLTATESWQSLSAIINGPMQLKLLLG